MRGIEDDGERQPRPAPAQYSTTTGFGSGFTVPKIRAMASAGRKPA
jgi:hypothetical protein